MALLNPGANLTILFGLLPRPLTFFDFYHLEEPPSSNLLGVVIELALRPWIMFELLGFFAVVLIPMKLTL